MLTDIFAYRYADRPIWNEFRETDRVLLAQGFRMVFEQLFLPDKNRKFDSTAKNTWLNIHSKLCMELGKESLSPLYLDAFNTSKSLQYWGHQTLDVVCRDWMLAEYKHGQDPDKFMKERISFIELAFREHMNVLYEMNTSLISAASALALDRKKISNSMISVQVALSNSEKIAFVVRQSANEKHNAAFALSCEELNERFRRAKCPLNYHNGFIQIETDAMVQEQIAEPFWKLVSDPKWINVETDMMEAVDRSESAQRDPAVYAVRALESAIKIISNIKGWNTGKEKGASQFIDNLRSTANGSFIVEWEAEALRHIFSKVRNDLSHGPGSEPMPELTQQQTDWTIEASMSWTKSLIGRLESER